MSVRNIGLQFILHSSIIITAFYIGGLTLNYASKDHALTSTKFYMVLQNVGFNVVAFIPIGRNIL